jgi:hypothetical protein
MVNIYLTEILGKSQAGPNIRANTFEEAEDQAEKIGKESNIALVVIGKLIMEYEQFELN